MLGVGRIVPPFGRGTRIRTRTNGFGDRRAAIDTIPLAKSGIGDPWFTFRFSERQGFWGAKCKLNWNIEHIKSLPLTDTPVKISLGVRAT